MTHQILNIIFNLSKSVFIIVMSFFLIDGSQAQTNFPKDVQYKKIPTNAIALIAEGNTKEAIVDLSIFLKSFPNDAEANYCMAVAYSVDNNLELAMKYVEKALTVGLPIERFLAGPKTLLFNLVDSKTFKGFKEGRFVKLIHGPMLGDVTSQGAKLWVRTDLEAEVVVHVVEEGKEEIIVFNGNTTSEKDFTGIIQLEDLRPSTSYTYDVFIDGSLLFGNGNFKTLKVKGEKDKFLIGFGGGAGYTPWYERMWDTLSKQSFDAFLLLGDNVYIDYPEIPEAQEYCYYRRQSRSEFRRFTPNVPIYAIWDDHDFTVNDGEGGAEIDTPIWKRPVWELFKNQWANPYYGGGNDHPGCWFDFSMGDVDFIMLDCRYYRENPKEVKDPSMLGKFQKDWLKQRLLASTATFKVIASSVPWAKDTKPGSDDTWDGFANEREDIFSHISDNNIEGVLLISADRHRSDAWKVNLPNGYTTFDLMSSKLTNVHTHDVMNGSLFGYNKMCSFGTLEFDTTSDDPSIVYKIKNIENKEIHKMTIYKSQLDFEKDKVKVKKLDK